MFFNGQASKRRVELRGKTKKEETREEASAMAGAFLRRVYFFHLLHVLLLELQLVNQGVGCARVWAGLSQGHAEGCGLLRGARGGKRWCGDALPCTINAPCCALGMP